MNKTADIKPGRVTIVTQTRVAPGREAEFARWQQGIGEAAAEFPGFVEQTIMPPSPPVQTDWVILQRFFSADNAAAWLNSPRRLELLKLVLPILIGCDDVNIVPDGAAGALPAPVSAVISTRVKPGCEALYRTWEHKIAATQARARGFQGYRFERPIPGVQQNWLAIVRFDSEANMQAWLDSPERLALIKEAEPFTEEFHARIVRTGFDQWFRVDVGAAVPSAWKMNMLVLMMLYPVVFLLGVWFQKPLLTERGVPVWLSLFIVNGATVVLLNYLVPLASRRFKWWLTPRGAVARINFIGTALVIALYGLSLFVFAVYSNWPLAR
jgi:antibiotic biosynthesis monooxygenase (ABM) superfamily enzyme